MFKNVGSRCILAVKVNKRPNPPERIRTRAARSVPDYKMCRIKELRIKEPNFQFYFETQFSVPFRELDNVAKKIQIVIEILKKMLLPSIFLNFM